MKIESQCCTLEQAKKLKELGILQKSFLYWYKDETVLGDDEPYRIVQMLSSTDSNYSAFLVSELGVMLPEDAQTYHYEYESGEFNWITSICKHHSDGTWSTPFEDSEECPTEAQSRASLLIILLETGKITAEEVNNRLLNA